MERSKSRTERFDRVGRIIGGLLFVVAGDDIILAGAEYTAGHPYKGTLFALLVPVSLVVGGGMWVKSADMIETDELSPPEVAQSSYTHEWVKDIGWVPRQSYGTEESIRVPNGDD